MIVEDGPLASGLLRLLSFNLFLKPPLLGDSAEHKEGRLSYFTEHVLGRHDILCLQEVFSDFRCNRRQAALVEAAASKGYNAVQEGRSWTLFFRGLADGGLIILSKLPVVLSRHHIYSNGRLPDSLSRKGALYARLRLPHGGHVHVVNTHLQASYGDGEARQPYRKVRKKQISELVRFVQKCTRDDGGARRPILLCGDLNIDSRAEPFDGATDSDEYASVLALMREVLGEGSCVDVLRERCGHHPVTFGEVDVVDGGLVPREQCLSDSSEVLQAPNQSLDKILYSPPAAVEGTGGGGVRLSMVNASVDELRVDRQLAGSTLPALPANVTHLSDHYGVELSIRWTG